MFITIERQNSTSILTHPNQVLDSNIKKSSGGFYNSMAFIKGRQLQHPGRESLSGFTPVVLAVRPTSQVPTTGHLPLSRHQRCLHGGVVAGAHPKNLGFGVNTLYKPTVWSSIPRSVPLLTGGGGGSLIPHHPHPRLGVTLKTGASIPRSSRMSAPKVLNTSHVVEGETPVLRTKSKPFVSALDMFKATRAKQFESAWHQMKLESHQKQLLNKLSKFFRMKVSQQVLQGFQSRRHLTD